MTTFAGNWKIFRRVSENRRKAADSDASEHLFRLRPARAHAGGVAQPERITVDEVADAFGISRHHLVKIVHDLGRHGYLATRRGIGGGFTLALPPKKICVGDVVRLGEESELVIDCKDRQNRFCRIFPACRLKGVLDEAAAAFFAVLDSYTLEDLLGQSLP